MAKVAFLITVLLLLLVLLAGVWRFAVTTSQSDYLEVWFDCPDGVAIVWWAEAGYPPSASDEEDFCANIQKLEEEWEAEHGDETQE